MAGTTKGALARRLAWAAGLAMVMALHAPMAQAGKVLDGVRARGQLVCGVNTGLAGFSAADESGRWAGLDVDVCRAVAAAVLGHADKVRYVPLSAPQRLPALQSGEIDLLSRNTTITLSRGLSMGLQHTAVAYYDGQGFIVPARGHVKNLRQLKGLAVCVQANTTSERNLREYSQAQGLALKPVVFDKSEAATAAYFAGRCAAYTSDASGLASVRARQATRPGDHAILPELISKEPLGPYVRAGDEEWQAIVTWTLHGLVEAEELGITQAKVDMLKASSVDPDVQRLLGAGEDTGRLLGLDKDWLARAVKATGNYGEIFERHVGAKSPLGLPRGLNNLWNRGGLMYAYPLR